MTFVLAVRNVLSIPSEFTLVLEDDGSSVSDDVIRSLIDDNENISTLMVLQPGQTWTPCSYSLCSYLSVSDGVKNLRLVLYMVAVTPAATVSQ